MRTLLLAALLWGQSALGQTLLKNAKLQNAKIGQVTNTPAPSFGTYTLIDTKIAFSNGNTATTSPSDTTGVKLIDIMTGRVASASVSDNVGANTYTAGIQTNSSVWVIQHFYCTNVTANASMTWTFSGVSAFPMIVVKTYAYTGTTPKLDGEIANASAVATTIQAGSISSSSGTPLVVSGLVWQDSGAIAGIDSSFNTPTQSQNGGAAIGMAMADLIQSGGGASVNPLWTLSSAEFNVEAINAAFK